MTQEPLMEHALSDPINPAALDRFTRLAARVLDVPAVCVSLVDEHHRLVVSSHGLGRGGRLAPPAANGDRHLTAHVEMPLVTADGRQVGTLTVMDRKPLRWNAPQLEFLKELSLRIVGEVDIGPVERMM